ncbi:hypothetical protein BN7_3563 [Wickerhamomyces ciferrii]|uniref:Transcription regulator Rua1 C-terminal domain-containing protein n=1 Tax=Wickerhamomyces ciferrii (strain ATCC 14091 / BCRC 22168 / CBS 111 / JCM 3599 / NBRC 0793 / NRRL Y-1031 F-60-10) TaxID=1206466 RepID=K0KLY1_WICCF|nr:uncharacterized protein BN7_3563 [Wickerhamomyces ciferrii]CCH44006.1 hypothetical protein BN7_3563 [Wickerhamomyces ciferrii]
MNNNNNYNNNNNNNNMNNFIGDEKYKSYLSANQPRVSQLVKFYDSLNNKIPGDKLFLRQCATVKSKASDNLESLKADYHKYVGHPMPNFKLERSEKHDENNLFSSNSLHFKIKQTASSVESKKKYPHPKYNSYYFCEFCDLKHLEKNHKHTTVEMVQPNGGTCHIDTNKFQNFYDTGSSQLSHHLGVSHGILKESIMPQPFVGFSRSLKNSNGEYKLSMVCPHQHWSNGKLVGCNAVFEIEMDKLFNDHEHPYKPYFRHFYKYHKTQKTAGQDQTNNDHKHIHSKDNVFLPIFWSAFNDTINYQRKNTKNGYWNHTLETVGREQILHLESNFVQHGYQYRGLMESEEPSISHKAVSRSKSKTPSPKPKKHEVSSKVVKPNTKKQKLSSSALGNLRSVQNGSQQQEVESASQDALDLNNIEDDSVFLRELAKKFSHVETSIDFAFSSRQTLYPRVVEQPPHQQQPIHIPQADKIPPVVDDLLEVQPMNDIIQSDRCNDETCQDHYEDYQDTNNWFIDEEDTPDWLYNMLDDADIPLYKQL